MAEGRIRITDATRELIGAAVVAFLERQEFKPDAILSRLDFTSDNVFGWLADQGRMDNMFNLLGVDDDIPNGVLRRLYDRIVDNDDNATLAHLKELAARMGTSGEELLESDVTIATAFTGTDPAKIISKQTGIPEEHLSELVKDINIKDLAAYALFHEAGHADPSQVGTPRAEREYHADIYANKLYKAAYAEGIVTDPRVPEVFAYIRSMTHFKSFFDDDYAYNGAIPPADGTGGLETDHETSEELEGAIKAVYADIARPSVNTAMKINALSLTDYYEYMTPEQIETLERLYDLPEDELIHSKEAADFVASITVPEDQLEYYNKRIENDLYYEGWQITRDQPELIYNTILQKLVAGEYDDQPHVKQQMENYVIGAERLAPEHYGIEGTPYLDHLRAQGEDVTLGAPVTGASATPVYENIPDLR